jgi:hypothetical protein
MPTEHETSTSVGPSVWPEDPDERDRLAREVTIRSKVMQPPEQKKPKGIEGVQTK